MQIANIRGIVIFWHDYEGTYSFWKRPRLRYFVKYFDSGGGIQKTTGGYIKKILWVLGLSISW